MNNLKFRAWDLKLKKFSFFDLSCCLPVYGDEEEFVIDQWTGLKDNQDKDIYSSDILQEVDSKELYVCEYRTTYSSGCFKIRNIEKHWDFGGAAKVYLRVISNVYEGAGLLKYP